MKLTRKLIIGLAMFVSLSANANITKDLRTISTSSSTKFVSGVIGTTSAPEINTYSMILAGLGLMAFIARRRRSN